MSHPSLEARELLAGARESLRRGDKTRARQLGQQAARLAPDAEDAWLVLAAAAADAQEALACARRAQQINPRSERARRAVEWAETRPQEAATPPAPGPGVSRASPPTHTYAAVVAAPILRGPGRNWLMPALLIGLGGMAVAFIAVVAWLAGPPALLSLFGGAAPTGEPLWASAEIAKPEGVPVDMSAFALPATGTPVPALEPAQPTHTVTPRAAPSQTPTSEPTKVPAATETPGVVAMEILEDTPTSEVIPPTPGITVGDGVRWIDVDLTHQMVYAYEGDTVVNSFVVSTGTWLTPTVTGRHKIYIKVRVQDMRGPGYHLRDVPYVMFFKGDYGLHGTYWHNNFGTPMSRGCVNLTIDDAAWLFNWASVGTVVNVHY